MSDIHETLMNLNRGRIGVDQAFDFIMSKIKSDRALLEEVLERMNSAVEDGFDGEDELRWYVDFLARAPEGGKSDEM